MLISSLRALSEAIHLGHAPKKVDCRVAALLAMTIFSISFPAHAITEEKEKEIKALIKVIGLNSIAKDMADSMVTIAISQEKQKYPNMPKEVEHVVSKAIYDAVIAHSSELDALVLPLYDKYYTQDDIKQLNAFFSSPIGQKYSALTMPMMQDMTKIGQEWGKVIAKVAAKTASAELKKRGYE